MTEKGNRFWVAKGLQEKSKAVSTEGKTSEANVGIFSHNGNSGKSCFNTNALHSISGISGGHVMKNSTSSDMFELSKDLSIQDVSTLTIKTGDVLNSTSCMENSTLVESLARSKDISLAISVDKECEDMVFKNSSACVKHSSFSSKAQAEKFFCAVDKEKDKEHSCGEPSSKNAKSGGELKSVVPPKHYSTGISSNVFGVVEEGRKGRKPVLPKIFGSDYIMEY